MGGLFGIWVGRLVDVCITHIVFSSGASFLSDDLST